MYLPNQFKIVILESNHSRRDYLKSLITGLGHIPFCFEREYICFDNLTPLAPDLVIFGSPSQNRTLRFINTLGMINRNLPALVISGDHNIQDFITTNGFSDILVMEKAPEASKFNETVSSLLSNNRNKKAEENFPIFVGNSPPMAKIKKMASKLSHLQENILVQGESGTGKELLAKVIHNWSNKGEGQFVKLDSATLSPGLLKRKLLRCIREEEFENPTKNQNERFEISNSGTLYLDQIEKTPSHVQAELAEIIDEFGKDNKNSSKPDEFYLRIIASTRSDIDLLVEKGYFRHELFYRINVFRIQIPPLRTLGEDILLLTDFFTDKYCREFSRSYYELTEKTKESFCRYHWPGNVRELEGLAKKIVGAGDEESVVDSLVQHDRKTLKGFSANAEDIENLAEIWDVKKYLQDLNTISLKNICREFSSRAEKKLILQALQRTKWNRKKAAKILNMSYKSLLNKIIEYNLP